MIKNQKQAAITKAKLAELISARNEFQNQELDKSSPKYLLGTNSFNSLIEDLEKEIQEYEGLVNSNFHCLQATNLVDIPKVLIGARLAQKMSHKYLGEQLGLKEQQIQRYEATDYETASWPRIVEVAMALNLNFKFEKNIIINSDDEEFDYPTGISSEIILNASRTLQQNKAFIF